MSFCLNDPLKLFVAQIGVRDFMLFGLCSTLAFLSPNAKIIVHDINKMRFVVSAREIV